MINVRHLEPTDNLEKAADLIYQVDPYICPDLFGDRERAAKFGKILFRDDGSVFDFDNVLVAEDSSAPGQLLGILVYGDNKVVAWNCTVAKQGAESLGIAMPENFDRANEQYMKPLVEGLQKLPDGVAEITWLATDSEARGKGVAQALLKTFLANPKYHEQDLTVLADNPAGIHVYKKFGFKIVSTQSGYPDESVKTYNMIRLPIPIEVSARHVHLSQHLVNILFGENYQLTLEKNLSQPGEFRAKERISIVGPREILHDVALLGPTREHTQVEISLTDARKLGLKPPVRESGDHEGSASCRLVGPAGEFELQDGVIIAHRHLHCPTALAERLGLKNGDLVMISVRNCLRPLMLEDVLVRVKDTYALSLHLDADEGNAAGLTDDSFGLLIQG